MDRIDWQPGESGKGIVDQDGHVHAWNDEDYELHRDYIEENGIPYAQGYFYIRPDGAIELTMPNRIYDGRQKHDLMMEHILDADPEFHAQREATWDF